MGLATVATHWLFYAFGRRNSGERTPTAKFDLLQLRGSLISVAVYSAIAVSAADLGHWGLHLLSIACVWLLLSGCFEAFWLLEPGFDPDAATTSGLVGVSTAVSTGSADHDAGGDDPIPVLDAQRP